MKKESGSRAQDMQPTYYLKPGRLDELLKNRPKRSPAIFCQNYYMTFNLEKSRQKLKKKLHKENSRPIVENSTNVVTLPTASACAKKWKFFSSRPNFEVSSDLKPQAKI
jgi:hypothetical protein